MTKKSLYESIMKSVSKIIKKRLNESESSWQLEYKSNLMTWVDNVVNNDEFITHMSNELYQQNIYDASVVGYAIAQGLSYTLEDGGMDMIIPHLPDFLFLQWLVKSLITGYDMKVNDDTSSELLDKINDAEFLDDIVGCFIDYINDEGYYFEEAISKEGIYHYAENSENYVTICNSEGEWEGIN